MFRELNQSIARERAAYLRDLEYIRENVRDSAVQEEIFSFESARSDLTPEEKKAEEVALMEAAEEIKVSSEEQSAEIDRIVAMESGKMSLDEVMFENGENPELCAMEAFEEETEYDDFFMESEL